MIHIKHTGIWVNDIEMMSDFYANIFEMKEICRSKIQDDELTSELYGCGVAITKLITKRGCETGVGDMIELISKEYNQSEKNSHIAFGIQNIENIVEKIKKIGGKQMTEIHSIGMNKVCFCYDPENNIIELIENGEE